MKSSRTFAVVMALATSFGFLSAAAHAQTVGNGPYYATPSWDQTLPANTRFIVLSNMNSEAVLDRETGLVWEKSPATTRFNLWDSAVDHCYGRATGGRKGWRLPTLTELQSLVDPTQSNPALPAGHPFIGIQFEQDQSRFDFYYSATSTTSSAGFSAVYSTLFKSGSFGFAGKIGVLSNEFPHAWCVRGGETIDPR
jgi:Protein of unknown function (DUF1566)